MGLFDRFKKKEQEPELSYFQQVDRDYEKAMKEAEDQIADLNGRLSALNNAPGDRRARNIAQEEAQRLFEEMEGRKKQEPPKPQTPPKTQTPEANIYIYYVQMFDNTFLSKEQFLNPTTKEQLEEKKRLLQAYGDFMEKINNPQEEQHRSK